MRRTALLLLVAFLAAGFPFAHVIFHAVVGTPHEVGTCPFAPAAVAAFAFGAAVLGLTVVSPAPRSVALAPASHPLHRSASPRAPPSPLA